VVQADDSLRAQMSHLSQCDIPGPHRRFDLSSDLGLKFCPTAFLGNILSMISSEFSSVQLGQYLLLILGLVFFLPPTTDGKCFCGRENDSLYQSRSFFKRTVNFHILVVDQT
jgi:hypothetical protein